MGLEDLFDALHGFEAVVPCAESGDADVALAVGAKAFAGSDHHVGVVEQSVEEVPGVLAVGRRYPDVGRVLAAIDRQSEEGEALADELGVLHVVLDGGAHLLLTLGCEDGFSATLGDVAGTVELAALATVPERVEACAVVGLQFLGDDGVAAAHAGESSGLREAAELDGALLRALNLVDGVGDGVVHSASFAVVITAPVGLLG